MKKKEMEERELIGRFFFLFEREREREREILESFGVFFGGGGVWGRDIEFAFTFEND